VTLALAFLGGGVVGAIGIALYLFVDAREFFVEW